jgi:hypothetical protein
MVSPESWQRDRARIRPAIIGGAQKISQDYGLVLFGFHFFGRVGLSKGSKQHDTRRKHTRCRSVDHGHLAVRDSRDCMRAIGSLSQLFQRWRACARPATRSARRIRGPSLKNALTFLRLGNI